MAVAAAAAILAAATASAGQSEAATHRVSHQAQRLALTALTFAPRTVSAQSGTGSARLSWTITDSRRTARSITGELVLAAPGTRRGTYLTAQVTVRFALHRRPSGTRSAGSARKSTYAYTFDVPQYARASRVRWQVISLTAADNKGDKLVLPASRLARFKATLTATEEAETDGPAFNTFELYSLRPYVYSGSRASGSQTYTVCVYPSSPAGFTTGTLQLSGPDSEAFTAQFSYSPVAPECLDPSEQNEGQQYIVPVKFPAGLAPGTWSVSRLQLTDAAGNMTTGYDLGAPVIVSSNQVLTASGFTASPSPADDWSVAGAKVTVSMNVSGASGGVTGIDLDFAGEQPGAQITCLAGGAPAPQPPVTSGTDTVSVQFSMAFLTASCQLDGIAILDGAGDVALYGSEYGAPDPGLTVTRIPDTTPPVATSASLSPDSGSGSDAGQYLLTVGVMTQVAPVADVAIRIYNSQGLLQGPQDTNGGVTQDPPTGAATVTYPVGTAGLAPGTYTLGFTISDTGNLSSSYGPGGTSPIPGGGTLTFTVPAS